MSLKRFRSVAAIGGFLAVAGAFTAPVAAEVPMPMVRPAALPAVSTAPNASKPASAPGTANAKPATKPTGPVVAYTHGRVYLLRGLANVFSRGMDQIGVRLKALGVNVDVENHARWHDLSDQIIADYKADKTIGPIILIGHSLGADACLVMATRLALNNVPVRLVITFDGVADTPPVIGNEEIINYYKPNGYGRKVDGSKNFSGTIDNVDLTKRTDIDHLNIDKIQALQDDTVNKVLEVLKEKPKVAQK